ncbi:MAG: hypothetical protein HGA96_09185 [Desulfobulbaceae bacterium]|nr:hypothetical protein [Desulfobulbaceae bacterium]
MLRIHFDPIRNRIKARLSYSLKGIVLSVILHLAVITFPGSSQLAKLPPPPDSLSKQVANPSLEERDGFRPGGVFSTPIESTLSGAEHPLPWNNPVFAQGALGPGITREKGRVITTYSNRPPFLRPPEFTPYIPPTLAELAIDPDHDVLRRAQPADAGKNDLEQEKRLFRRALAEDLRDCRLDRISLAEALLKLSYFRLADELWRQGKKPDFSYAQLRDHLDDKMAALRREENEMSQENWATALLLTYRKDKIYEERRGHSLLNSIWYDLYNCRTGSEELLIYFSRYHPELELATVRGSVLKSDGTLMGHMDPAVKINGRWMVFKTVAMDTLLVEEYRIGDLYPLEKIVLDYLPDLEDEPCRLSSPMARNGEPLTGDIALYRKSDHPLAVKDKVTPIVLWRESTPYTGPFRMMGQEDRLLHEMLSRYQTLTSERQLLNADDPFADLLFQLLLTAPGERHSLLDLYLRKRVTTYPARFKRPLRPAAYIPSYGDLLTTMEQGPSGRLEIAPGNLLPLAHFSGHGKYLRANNGRMTELTRVPPPPGKRQLAAEVKKFLFTTPGEGVTAIFPPRPESLDLVADLLDDAYDLSMPPELEQARRANATSTRAIAVVKAGLLDQTRESQELLDKRITLLQEVLAHKAVDFAGGATRSRHEIPASLSFAETVAQGGRQGLSPGFIKDMVELMGEDEAVHSFRNYLQPLVTAGPAQNRLFSLNRQRTAEMFGYFDRYLLLAKSREQIIAVARQLYEHQPELATRVGAAQFLISKGALDPTQAEKDYAPYLAQQPFDVRELRSLLETGLAVAAAREDLRNRISRISLQGLEKWNPGRAGNDQIPPEQLQLDELLRGAIMLGDEVARQVIAKKLSDLLLAVFATGATTGGPEATHYANGLDALSALSRSGIVAGEAVFPRFLEFGAHDPAGFLFAKLLENWLGPGRYHDLVAAAQKEAQKKFTAARDNLNRLRAQGESLRSAEDSPARQGWLANYRATLGNLAERVATITFLNGLTFLEGQSKEAHRLQTTMLVELFKQVEFQSNFAMTYGEEITAVRDQALLNELLFRAVELAGHFAQQSRQPGELDLNHAPTIRLEGEFLSPCGSMAKLVDGRNAPLNVLFTKGGIYFDTLLDPENSPAMAAEALRQERQLRGLLSKQPLTPRTGKELDDTEAFFQDLGQSGSCDIRRLYVLEKLLKRAAIPERVPEWILHLAQDSFRHEMAYLARIKRAGGVEAIFQDHRTLGKEEFRRRWGDHPFSIRNLYGTLVLVKMDRLRMNSSGEFETLQ